MPPRCLLIADDLTGGADTGAQFAKRGFNTLLISFKEGLNIDFSQYRERDVLVVNTDSRGSSPDKAFGLVSSLLKTYDEELFPVVYKKIDSTLRGNIGYEIDAILGETNISVGFMTPSFPEQERTVVDGVLMVWGKPLVLTEASSDAAAPVRESCVYKLVEQQSRHQVGWIDLAHVASSSKELQEAVKREREKGNRILIFDALHRSDLTRIADVAFGMDEKPLFIGSAGLAEEVAKKLSPSRGDTVSHVPRRRAKSFNHIFIVSGSASSVTHEQLKRIEQRGIPSFQLSKSLLLSDEESMRTEENKLSSSIGSSLAQGHAVFRVPPERLLSRDSNDTPIHLEIPKRLGHIGLAVLEKSNVDIRDLAVIVTGGDTAMSLFHVLGAGGVEIGGEILKGIVMGRLIGGKWNGLTVITKAGAFGRENALEEIMDILERASPSSPKGK
ncbi:MAG: hypothetical protein GTO13_06475 [Proteobacteria bacterium]|nr:hypothetical protein [Pseudomonadota bacterium]